QARCQDTLKIAQTAQTGEPLPADTLLKSGMLRVLQ
ncbi:MAG: hypothetical protein RIR90_630, partial [Bacteroidota bacterium]